ncbi:MAG: bifunctional riboflavin kinase/FAD synthetase [Aggregatilineales bacterium]
MTHVQQLEAVQPQRASIVSIGVFDGMHRGHQALIQRLVDEAHAADKLAIVLTFFPHPDALLRNITDRYYLTTSQQRADLMLSMGVDYVVTYPFNDTTRHMRAADFVDKLCEYLHMSALWVGEDFAMGYQREGDVTFLTTQGKMKDFTVQALKPVMIDGQWIKSTAIRAMLQAGHVDTARTWLGRGYTVIGEVVHGQQRGRTIGFPTANLAVDASQIIPAKGVYAGWATINDERFMAVTNIGERPTFDGHGITVEAFLMDFDRDIYGQSIHLSFETRLRDEQKFDGLEALVAQLNQDVAAGQDFLR